MIVPLKIQGACGQGRSPRDIRMDFAFSYQCRGDHLRLYSVFKRRRYVLGLERGHPVGGLII